MGAPAWRGWRRGWRRGAKIVLLAAPGWVWLVVAHWLVLPVFGVLSPVTWAAIWAGWLWILAAPGYRAVRGVVRSDRVSGVTGGVLAVLAAGLLWSLGPPHLSLDSHVDQHRSDLAQLAAEYRAGPPGDGVDLRWRVRSLSTDGRAHHRCGLTDSTGRRECALYLPMWQDWRAENGAGIAYFPHPPGPDASIATAAGDIGVPSRPLGGGWWLVD